MAPGASSYPLVTFENVSKSFQKKNVLSHIYLQINTGDIFGIMGLSGAGKTTLLRLMIGFYPADSGKIYFRNQNIAQNLYLIRRIFGFSSSDHCFYQELTLRENLRYFGRMYGLSAGFIDQRSKELLHLVGLWSDQETPAQDLSSGMQRRFDIACSLIHAPKILILDEPTQGLDPLTRKQMWTLIQKLNTQNMTIILSSHRLDEMEHVCNRVAMLHHGHILISGTPNQLKDAYSRNEEISLETFPGNYVRILSALQMQGFMVQYVRYAEHKVMFYTPATEKTLHALLHVLGEQGERLLDVEVNKPNLNEVFEVFSHVQ